METGVTLRQIAALAGCSHTTVSMALRGHPRVSVETRDRIRKLAREAGYQRDPVVASLMGQLRTKRDRRDLESIGIINCWDTPEGDRATVLGQELHAGISSRAAQLGYQVDYLWARQPGMTARRLTRILLARGIRGLLVLSMLQPRGHIPLDWSRFAAAVIGYTLHKPELHRVNYSHYHAMVLALRTLRHRGYRRIGFTNLIEQEDMVHNERLSAFLGYHYRVSREQPIPPLLLKDWDAGTMEAWVNQHRPQVVLSNNSAACRTLWKLGIAVPEQIGFVSLDCIDQALPTAGIRLPRDLVGARAMDILAQQLENHEFGIPAVPTLTSVKGFWQEGPTLLPGRCP